MDSVAGQASAGATSSVKARRFACIRCRQSKIRCDNEQDGQPCRRCASQGLSCDYDADYKRVNKKRKIQELVGEVQRLRANAESSRSSPLPHASRGPSAPTPSPVPPTAPLTFTPPTTNPSAGGDEHNASATPQPSSAEHRTLGHLVMSGAESSRLFAKFFDTFHPFIGLVDANTSPDRAYHQSPLLFWAIIGVASRHDTLNSTLQVTLAPSVTELLWTTFARSPYSVADIQGMLLLCLWPFPAPSMSNDSRYPLVAATRSAAMQIGLHYLNHMRDFSHVKSKVTHLERVRAARTWATCVVAVESVTGFVGQPSLVRDEVTSDHVLAPAPESLLPPQLDQLFRIFTFCNRVHRIMASSNKETADVIHGEGTVILTILEREFKSLWTTLGDDISAPAKAMLSFAGLQMRAYYFFERQLSTRRRLGILRAYQLTLQLVTQLREVDGTHGMLRYAPVVYQDALIFATIFLLKVVKSNYAEDIDVAAGNTALDFCLAKLRECVSTTGDFRSKLPKMLAQLRTMEFASRDAGDREPHLKLRTRFSGSLLHDSLWLWREQFGGQGQSSARASPSRQTDAAPTSSTLETPDDAAATERLTNNSQGDATLRQTQPQLDYAGLPVFSSLYPDPQGLNSSAGQIDGIEDHLFADIFGHGGIDPLNLADQRADVDWFYQADSLNF